MESTNASNNSPMLGLSSGITGGGGQVETAQANPLNVLAKKVTDIFTTIANIESKFDQLEESFEDSQYTAHRVGELEAKVDQLETEKTALEAKINELEGDKAVATTPETPFDAHIRRLETMHKAEKFDLSEKVKSLEDKLHEANRERMRLIVKLGVEGIESNDTEVSNTKRKREETKSGGTDNGELLTASLSPKENGTMRSGETVGVKKARGRPRTVSLGATRISRPDDDSAKEQSLSAPRGRPRGRPRIGPIRTPSGRPRGRPRKDSNFVEVRIEQ